MGKNKKPMLTVLVEEEKLQRFRDYASLQGISMGAIVNQLIDRLLSGESSPEPIESSIGNSNKYIETMMTRTIDKYRKSIEKKIALSIDNNNKSIEAIIANSIGNNNESLEQTMAASMDNYTKTLPPTLSLQDIERETRRECGRLIGSAISSVTKTNNEVIAELKNIIGHQGAEIARLSKLFENYTNAAANSKPSQPPNSLAWGGFCELINEPLPSDRNKINGDKMTIVASNKGFNGWKYNGNSKKFTHQPI
jgi:F0F1-type ATP synthase membrane subunit b/b'